MNASTAVTGYTATKFVDSSTRGSFAADVVEAHQGIEIRPYDINWLRQNFSTTSVRHTADPDSVWSQHFTKLANLHETERPSAQAYTFCWRALRDLALREFEPTRVVSSAEGGLAICFVRGDLYGDLEFLDSGEILGVVSNRRERPVVWQIGPSADDMSKAIDRIREFFDASTPVSDVQKRSWIRRWLQT